MIDFLSNPDWLRPQIDFLLFLQNIRLEHLEIFDKFFLSVTVLGEYWLPTLICAIVYWCIDFRAGMYLFSLESFGILIAHFSKMIACVYRPWILDGRIQPSKLAYPFAKGYSFPSGHSSMSSSVLGGVAYLTRKKKLLPIILVGAVLLVMFSRMWLGVHTPQDVICGFLIGFVLVFAINPLIDWAEKDKNRYLYLLAVIDVLVVLALIFLYYFNTYRIDYVDGKILVDTKKLMYHTLVLFAYASGIINGCFLCRRFWPFNPKEASVKRRVVRGIAGAILIIFVIKSAFRYVVMNILDYKTALCSMFLMGITVTLIYPVIFKKVENLIYKK